MSSGYKPRLDLPILSSFSHRTHHQINMPSTSQSAQNSKVPVTQAGTVPDGTCNDSKIVVGISSVNPPTHLGSYLEGGSKVKFYCTSAAKSAFLANPKAVTNAADMATEAHEQSYYFMKSRSQNGQNYSVDHVEQWKKQAEELDAATELKVDAFNNLAKESNIRMEVVRTPTEEWETSSGVTEVKLFEIMDAGLANQRLLISTELLNRDPSHPPASCPSVASVSNTGDLAGEGQ